MQQAPLKTIIVVFVIETTYNTGYVGGFLQVQDYWGVNISCELVYKNYRQFTRVSQSVSQSVSQAGRQAVS